jgi:putative peptidoglycan lipid II flippase
MTNLLIRRGMVAVFSTTAIVAVGTVVAKAAGLGKELYVAFALGPGPQLDAFLFAYVFPALLINVIGGALQAALVPQYLATMARQGAREAGQLAGEAAALIAIAQLVAMLLFIPVVMLLIPWLASGFDTETQRLTQALTPLLMPLVVMSTLSAAWSGLLNAHGKFTAAAFIPVITPVAVILGLMFPLPISGAYRITIGTIIGAGLELAVIARCLREIDVPLLRRPQIRRAEIALMLRQFLPAMGSSFLMSATLLIDQTFAARLPAGSVSALSYGTRLTGVIATVLITVISAIALPAFSRFAADGNYVRLRQNFLWASAAILAVALPSAAICSFAAHWIVHLMYVRGEFSVADVELVASVQALHAWHVPVYALAMLAVRGLAAVRATWLAFAGSILNLFTDIAVNTTFVPILGVSAIGLATTLMYTVAAAFLVTVFLWQLRPARKELP